MKQPAYFSPPSQRICQPQRILAALLLLATLGAAPTRAQQPAKPIRGLPIEQAELAFDAAMKAGDEPAIIDALYHRHPALLTKALQAVAQRRIKAAMPRLIEMHGWLNAPDGGPFWTGGGTFWDEHRDGTTIELSDEVVAAVDAITAKAVPPPKDHSYAEAQRYLTDVKAWWQGHGP